MKFLLCHKQEEYFKQTYELNNHFVFEPPKIRVTRRPIKSYSIR